MSRRSLVRFQLMILALLVLALFGRRMWSTIGGGDDVEIGDVEPFELHQVAFRVDEPTRVEVDVVASLERGEPDAPLATTAWIMGRGNPIPAWHYVPGPGDSRRGTLVSGVQEVTLDAGTYDLYFASYGNDMHGGRRGGFLSRIFDSELDWEGDSGRWSVSVRAVEEGARLTRIEVGSTSEAEGVVWQTAPMQNNREDKKVFEVLEPLDVQVYAVGELSDDGRDYGWIENLGDRRRVWELTPDASAPAGGHSSNRMSVDTLHLSPGVYAAHFETDAGHAAHSWRANPPFDPEGWGISIRTAPERLAAIADFDPWETRSPLIELTRIGSSQHDHVAFTVAQSTDVVINALGEVSSSDQYDYGWIQSESGEKVWEMRHDNTTSAGGDHLNREALEIVRLPAGRYEAHFQTDDSHAHGDWQKDSPRRPERWGMAIFPLNRELPAEAFAVLERVTSVPSPPEPPQGWIPTLPDFPDLPDLPSIEALQRHVAVRMNGVGNGANLREEFHLRDPRDVIVIAQGEILPTDRYDFAWIERADNGETVWSMTWDNTIPAGGDERNRAFAGSVTLDAGNYVVRYRSDPSHAFGDFGKIAPNSPQSWGISVVVPPDSVVVDDAQ